MKKFLLLFLLSVILHAKADDNVLHKIEESDSATVFACSNLLRANVNTPNLKPVLLRSGDIQVINELIANRTIARGRQERQINKHSSGLVIQVGENRPIYIGDTYWYIQGEFPNYSIPEDLRIAVKEMTNHYLEVCPQKQDFTKYDHLPMCSREVGRRNKNIMFYSFYVLEPSGNVLNVEYCLQYNNKYLFVTRSVDTCIYGKYLRTNEEGMFVFRLDNGVVKRIYKESESTHKYISKMIPEWSNKTDQERMRILDGYLEK